MTTGGWRRLRTRTVGGREDIRAHFDAFAPENVEQHGSPARLLAYRVGLLAEVARLRPGDTVLEIGCGDGIHLLALAERLGRDADIRGIGIDLSPAMVASAGARLAAGGLGGTGRIGFRVDEGTELATLGDATVDVVYCVGSLEHMVDQAAVARAVARVLKPGGRFVGLTPNGGYLWYRNLAPLLALETRHLSSDRFLTAAELKTVLGSAGFRVERIDHWSFVPGGDMHPALAMLLRGLDGVGQAAGAGMLRGGLRFAAVLPDHALPATSRR
ncbi:class I SAM-dependent methyltransferase [Arenibaculum sp.]|jgi:2-polyprenyl-6-hydroxyphenyl methylase/3-demethylubiquinone-9 3-methyltransferase|uniref:class I SAM-dependent methyltransferase n=1 Tax=Arenibaculum sp. TaxID=2865862 RepID=UPI002E138F4D|nr:methyltransferase domain-containing protein [Arenibaculum sp.]